MSYFVRICTSGSENRALASFQRGVLKNFGNKSIHRIKFKFLVLFFIRLWGYNFCLNKWKIKKKSSTNFETFRNSFGLSCSRYGGLVLPSRSNLSKSRCHVVQREKNESNLSFLLIPRRVIKMNLEWRARYDLLCGVDLNIDVSTTGFTELCLYFRTVTCTTMYELKLLTNYKFLLEHLASLLLSISPLITNHF